MNNEISVPYLSRKDLNRASEVFLKTYHPSNTIPVPIEEIVEFQLGIDIIPITGLHQSFDTDGFISSDLKSISVDLFVYESRRNRYRFTLAHEIGHCVLHGDLYKKYRFRTLDEWKDFVINFPEKEYRWLEWHAYTFAGLILVPSSHLAQRYEFNVKEVKSMGISFRKNRDFALDVLMTLLAEEFLVSKEVIHKRLLNDRHI